MKLAVLQRKSKVDPRACRSAYQQLLRESLAEVFSTTSLVSNRISFVFGLGVVLEIPLFDLSGTTTLRSTSMMRRIDAFDDLEDLVKSLFQQCGLFSQANVTSLDPKLLRSILFIIGSVHDTMVQCKNGEQHMLTNVGNEDDVEENVSLRKEPADYRRLSESTSFVRAVYDSLLHQLQGKVGRPN
jgi:hypothetical protein